MSYAAKDLVVTPWNKEALQRELASLQEQLQRKGAEHAQVLADDPNPARLYRLAAEISNLQDRTTRVKRALALVQEGGG